MLKSAIARLRRKRFVRLQFFMKSGHTFTLDRVKEFDLTANSNKITKISLTQDVDGSGTTLLVAATDLDQIEAVVRLPR